MAAATAATKKLESELDDLRGKANLDLRAVGTAASATGRDLTKLGAETKVAARGLENVGDEAKEAGRDLMSLAARIEAAKLALHGLSLEFAGSGDRSLTPKIRNARRELSELERVAKTITPGVAGAGQGLLSTLGGLGSNLRGALIPAAIGAAVALAPAIGAIIAGAVVGTVGLGGIAGGIAMAARDPRVKAAGAEFAAHAGEVFQLGGIAFVQPTIESLHILQAGLDSLHLGDALEPLAKVLPDVARGLSGFANEAMPGLNRALIAAGPALQVLGEELPGIGQAFGDMIGDISESQGAMDGLRFTLMAVRETFEFVGSAIVFLGNAFHVITAAGAKMSGVLEDVFLALGFFGPLMTPLSQGMRLLNDNLEETLGIGPKIVGAWAPIPGRMQAVVTAAQAANTELVKNASAAASSAAANESLTASFENAARAAHGLTAAFDELNGTMLTEREAARAGEEALDLFDAAIKASHGSLSKYTPEGRKAARALDEIGKKAAASAQAILDNGGTVEEAQAAYNHYVGALRKTLEQAGMTKSQIDKLIGSIAKMPPSKTTNIKQSGAQGAKAAVDGLRNAINSLHSKTVFVTSIVSSIVSGAKSTSAGHALGTPSAPPGLAWVGERGPELMSFVGGERVWPHQQSMGMARRYAGGTGGGASGWDGANLTVSFAGAATPFERALEAAMRRMNWNLGGGSTQVAQGRT